MILNNTRGLYDFFQNVYIEGGGFILLSQLVDTATRAPCAGEYPLSVLFSFETKANLFLLNSRCLQGYVRQAKVKPTLFF